MEILLSLVIIFLLSPVLLLCFIIASFDTKSFGIFVQSRIGQNGNAFKIYKLKTMSPQNQKVTIFGKFLRKTKIDELPQLINILLGQMSFVGPRPDIPGYADCLVGKDRLLLSLKPGLTGLASLKYRNEEELLRKQINPLEYNDALIWPDKVRINNWYAQNRNFLMDMEIIFYTFFTFFPFDVDEFIRKENI